MLIENYGEFAAEYRFQELVLPIFLSINLSLALQTVVTLLFLYTINSIYFIPGVMTETVRGLMISTIGCGAIGAVILSSAAGAACL